MGHFPKWVPQDVQLVTNSRVNSISGVQGNLEVPHAPHSSCAFQHQGLKTHLQKTSLLHAQAFPRTPCSGISEFYSKPIGALWFDPMPLCAEETELLDSNVRGRAGICPSLTTNAVTCCSCHNTLLRKGPVLVMWTSVLSVASLHPWLPFSLSPGLYTLDLVRCRAASGVGCLPAAQAELEGHRSELVLSPARPGAVIVQLLGQVQRTLTRRHQFSSEISEGGAGEAQ